jgi:hypothetical protein
MVTIFLILPVYLLPSFVVVAAEESDHYVQAAAVTVIAVLVLVYVMVLPARLRAAWLISGRPVRRSIGGARWTPPIPGLGEFLLGLWGSTLLGSPCFCRLSV